MLIIKCFSWRREPVWAETGFNAHRVNLLWLFQPGIYTGLRSIAGNLALDPLYDAVCEMVEPLRSGKEMDYAEMYKKIMEERDRLAAII